jgi:TolB protein
MFRAVLLGAAAGIATVAARGVDPAGAVLRFDLNQGNAQPMTIALPDFLAGSPPDGESARGISRMGCLPAKTF